MAPDPMQERLDELAKRIESQWAVIISLQDRVRNIELALPKPAESQYREPTVDDVGKEVEVHDVQDNYWDKRTLIAVVENREKRFVCRTASSSDTYCGWRHARIKVDN